MLVKPLRKSRRVFDGTKVTDHHAIIPTGKKALSLQDKEEKVYELIVLRFISVFYDDCTYMSTTVMAHSQDIKFKATGKVVVRPGWKEVLVPERDDEQEEAARTLPGFAKGEQGSHAPQLEEKKTVPPKPYTEATLLRAMETAGKFVEDEELRDALKQNGIGRPSSRAGIIETLCKRGYVNRVKRDLIPTSTGISLIGTIKSELLKSCELTGRWEKKLREIEQGRYDQEQFLRELKQQILVIIDTVSKDDCHHKIVSTNTSSQKSKPVSRYKKK